MDKTELADKIYDILKSDYQILSLTDYLMRVGAGTTIPDGMATEPARIWSWELAEALSDPRDTEWETEIGRMVMDRNIDLMRKAALQLHNEHNMCPYCRWTSRVRHRRHTDDYICDKCKRTWRI